MTEGPQDFFTKALIEFRAADALLSSELKLHEGTASTNHDLIIKKAGTARQIVTGYVQQIEGKNSFSDLSSGFQISAEIDAKLKALNDSTADIKRHELELGRLENEISDLERKLQATLLLEAGARTARRIGFAIAAIVLVLGIVALHFWLLKTTTLSMAFTLDGKPIATNKEPVITLDGHSFSNGGKMGLGRHWISVNLQDAEPVKLEFWAFYGRKNLGVLPLESSKGSLSVSADPIPTRVVVQGGIGTVARGDAPFRVEKLPVGNYTVSLFRSNYQETITVKIERDHLTETNVSLNIGSIHLSSVPEGAEYELSDSGSHWREGELIANRWRGTLPDQISDVPVGNYEFSVRRKGWEITTNLSVTHGQSTSNQTVFPYGTIELTSSPAGLIASTNEVELGRTPLTLQELRPGQYTLAVSDGENKLMTNVLVGENQVSKPVVVFRYGAVRLLSNPAGATVMYNGKEMGKTPLNLSRLPIASIPLDIRLPGYLGTNIIVLGHEGTETTVTVKLFTEGFINAFSEARSALDAHQFDQASKAVARAIQLDPTDSSSAALEAEIRSKAELWKKQEAEAQRHAIEEATKKVADELLNIPLLTPENVIADCWNETAKSDKHFSEFNTKSAAQNNPVAVPVAAATDAVVKSLEVLTLFKKKEPKTPRFNSRQFIYGYQNKPYRYYGTLSEVDLGNRTVAFVPGGVSKRNYTVVARFSIINPSTSFTLQRGSPIWVSGKLSDLEESGPTNRLILDGAILYAPNIISPNSVKSSVVESSN